MITAQNGTTGHKQGYDVSTWIGSEAIRGCLLENTYKLNAFTKIIPSGKMGVNTVL